MWVPGSTGTSLVEVDGEVPNDRVGSFVRIMGGGLDFVANRYVVPDPAASLSRFAGALALFGGTTSQFITLTTSNFVDTVNVTFTNVSGTGAVAYDPGTGRINVTGLDSSTVNTFNFTVVVNDGTNRIALSGGDTGTRSISFTDQRSIRFANAPTTFDLAAGLATYAFTIATGGNGQVSTFTESLNGVPTTGRTFPSGAVPLASFNAGPNTLGVSATFDRQPTRTPTLTRTVTGYLAWFFWTQADAPTTAAEFAGQVGTSSIALGQTVTSGPTSASYYVALPASAETDPDRRFTYTLGTGAVITPSEVPASPIMRNGVEYRVYSIPNLAPNSNVTIT